MLRLDGKVAIVTGAGSGIGAAITERFTSQGAAVAALDVDEVAAQRIVARLRKDGGNLEAFACDVGDADSVDRAIRGAVERFGKLDILVNNAGIAHIGTVQSTSEADLDRVYRVNVKGVYLCTKAAIPHLLNNGGGSIVNLASIASLIGLEDRFAYSMSKGAVLTMTRSVAVDYMSKNIRCNCLCPARVHTPFVDGYLKQHYPGREAEMFEKLSKYQPIGRMGRPDEVATLALYLASDDSSFITGQAFPIDGGVLVK
ncbi:MAG: SDR family oxidoreductase [Planctomycetes bacterium]|nr:SDR family oxidoreductase [Planctomycetota bacterium]